jgi:hypothetical protein
MFTILVAFSLQFDGITQFILISKKITDPSNLLKKFISNQIQREKEKKEKATISKKSESQRK